MTDHGTVGNSWPLRFDRVFVKLSRALTRSLVLIALAVTICAGCGARSGAQATSSTGGLTGIVQTPKPDVGAVVLPDAANGGSPFAMRADPGHVLLGYFGYTSCPDVCPTTLADVREALRKLGKTSASRVQLAMVTVDPRRDTAEVLTGFVHGFVRYGHALRTDDPAALHSAAAPFGVEYDVKVNPDGSEEVGHTSYVYAIDSSGHVLVQWSFGTKVSDLVHDLRLLLAKIHP